MQAPFPDYPDLVAVTFSSLRFAIGPADSPGLTIEQIKSTWNYKNGRMAGVVLPRRVAAALLKENDREKAEAKK
jgi:hypothetical protein